MKRRSLLKALIAAPVAVKASEHVPLMTTSAPPIDPIAVSGEAYFESIVANINKHNALLARLRKT